MEELRACYFCCLIKEYGHFLEDGCDNCRFFRGDMEDAMRECTTPNFQGMIAMNNSSESWVAGWQRIRGSSKGAYARGLYAISVTGKPPNVYIAEAKRSGYRYIDRDQHAANKTH